MQHQEQLKLFQTFSESSIAEQLLGSIANGLSTLIIEAEEFTLPLAPFPRSI